MKKILFAFFFVLGSWAVQAQEAEIKWMTLDEALTLQKNIPKKQNLFLWTFTQIGVVLVNC